LMFECYRQEMLQLGTCVAAMKIRQIGARAGMPSLATLIQELKFHHER